MTSRDFCYWLQGYIEVSQAKDGKLPSLDQDQMVNIQKHLSMVFKHEIDPSAGPKPNQDALDHLHGTSNPNFNVRC
jgi:hypothetical protein